LNELGIALGHITLAVNAGSWGSVPDLDVSLVDTALGKGDLYKLTAYLLHLGCIKLECGDFHEAELCAEKLHFITESYGYDFAGVHCHFVKTNILIRKGAFHKALAEADKGVAIADQADMNPPRLRSLGLKIIAEVLLGRPEKAALSVKRGETLLAELGIVGPLYRAPFMLGRLLTHLQQLTEALKTGNRSRIRQCEQETRVSAKQAVRVSKKHALYRTWILKSIGEYYWLIDEKDKAIKWWSNAINEGERLGSRLDLSSTYLHLGKRLLEPKCRYKRVNGIEAKGYLEKAQVLFEEIGLEGEMDDLERLKADRSFQMQ
jgi:tetratricopeptide (TPR) repeat protein